LAIWPKRLTIKNISSCGTGECIAAEKKCDGSQDCNDNTDEADCRKSIEKSLHTWLFTWQSKFV
jgi:hypothetical protein